MISSGDLRKGITIELDGKLYQVIDSQHIKMKRTALNRLKLRDIRDGHTIEQTFQNTEKFIRARLEFRRMQYLYNEADLYYFMDEENFEQIPISSSQLGDGLNYLKDGISVEVSSYKGDLVGVDLPITIQLQVTQTEPGFKGDTATGGTKPATLETGLVIQVPLFINEGDVIKVDTRTGVYLERSG